MEGMGKKGVILLLRAYFILSHKKYRKELFTIPEIERLLGYERHPSYATEILYYCIKNDIFVLKKKIKNGKNTTHYYTANMNTFHEHLLSLELTKKYYLFFRESVSHMDELFDKPTTQELYDKEKLALTNYGDPII